MTESLEHADGGGLSQKRAFSASVSPATFMWIAGATLALLWLVVTTGALVRLTASGLGCPHWPTCEANQLVPQDGRHAVIEFSNRVISGIAMLATVAAAVVAWRTRTVDRRVAWVAALAAAGTVAQVPLGAVTVAFNLNPYLVMSHFLLAMVVVALWTWVTVWAVQFHRGGPRSLQDGRLGLIAWAAALAALVLATSGAFVTAAGPHPGSTSKPIERLGNFYDAAWLHVRVATAFTVLFVITAVWLWRKAPRSPVALIALGGIALLGAQAIVGEYQYRNGLPWEAVAVHVALAATLLMVAVATATLTWNRWSRPADEPG